MQGFVLGQYGLLYALAHEDQVERLFILNTPLATNSKLRPELAAYKNPIAFLRPGNVSDACFCLCRSPASPANKCQPLTSCCPVQQQDSCTPVADKAGRNQQTRLGIVSSQRQSGLIVVLLCLLACLAVCSSCRSPSMEPCTI
jgi:hypothetical protein